MATRSKARKPKPKEQDSGQIFTFLRQRNQKFLRASSPLESLYGDTEGLDNTPSNVKLLERTKQYSKEVALVLDPGIARSREFFLNDLVPPMLAMQNGLQDGFDVLKLMLGESPNFNEIYRPMQALLNTALKLKMASFIAKHANLSREEVKAFIQLAFYSETHSGLSQTGESDSKYKVVNDLIRSLAGSGSSNTAIGANVESLPNTSPRRAMRKVVRVENMKRDSEQEQPRRASRKSNNTDWKK